MPLQKVKELWGQGGYPYNMLGGMCGYYTREAVVWISAEGNCHSLIHSSYQLEVMSSKQRRKEISY